MKRFTEVAKAATLLKRQADAKLRKRGAMNGGDKFEADYFAVRDLIQFFNDTREAAAAIVKARDALDGQYFFEQDG